MHIVQLTTRSTLGIHDNRPLLARMCGKLPATLALFAVLSPMHNLTLSTILSFLTSCEKRYQALSCFSVLQATEPGRDLGTRLPYPPSFSTSLSSTHVHPHPLISSSPHPSSPNSLILAQPHSLTLPHPLHTLILLSSHSSSLHILIPSSLVSHSHSPLTHPHPPHFLILLSPHVLVPSHPYP